MRRLIGMAIWAAASAAAAAEPDAAKLADACSLVAEAVALDRAEAAGRVPKAYTRALREDIEQDLQKLKDEPGLGEVAKAALADLRRHDTEALAALRDRLVAQERSHGRAD